MIFEKEEVVKGDGTPYKVYTPYSRKWLEKYQETPLQFYPSEVELDSLASNESLPDLNLSDLGFETSGIAQPEYRFDDTLID